MHWKRILKIKREMTDMQDIAANLKIIDERIKEAAEACGRKRDDVLLCAVSKTRTPEEINIAIDAGDSLRSLRGRGSEGAGLLEGGGNLHRRLRAYRR